MFKWLLHILIFATIYGKYQNKEKPLKRQRKLGLASDAPIRVHAVFDSDWKCIFTTEILQANRIKIRCVW